MFDLAGLVRGAAKKRTVTMKAKHLAVLINPPAQGELIELLRNKEASLQAGARKIPLPPAGRLVYHGWPHKHWFSSCQDFDSWTKDRQDELKQDYEDWKNGTGRYNTDGSLRQDCWSYWTGEK